MSNATVSEQLQQMWRTRPYRLPQRGHVAGVAAGIGYRYGVDPVLIRVALVVGTIFGGAGIVLYLAAWLLFSKAGDSASPAESLMGKGNSSESNTKVVVLVVALIIALSTIGPVGIGLGGSGVISMLALLAGLWLLHQRQPEPPEFLPGGAQVYAQQGFPMSFDSPYSPHTANHWTGAQYRPPNYEARVSSYIPSAYSPYTTLPKTYVPSPPSETMASQSEVNLSKAGPESVAAAGPTPPSWDPLGVAPFAWDLPEPATVYVPEATEKKERSRWTSSFIGLALVAAAVTAGISAATGADWLSPARIGAVALAVVAIGLILGAFMRKGYGLLVITGPLLAFVVFASILGPVSFDSQFAGEQHYAPTAVADLRPSYTVQGGDLQLDLRGLDLTENKAIAVDVTAGNATILIPDSMNIRADCSAVAAETKCGPNDTVQQGNSPDNTTVLTIDGSARAGNLEIVRG
ncbi:PspC domain-containing protein [Rhodococcus sp. G-MC3]|uniref:PspC domain-containing protein n=1 Tax=Rhodococcus sp. G-MC3 TaxID=3046209 RepID=UPI0024BA57AD|nr:PspC domain-containing protein [Rhodococcus sp. G-MC3]MDJ0392693.1 PspC domain-containing protein [Rhodococcus sp. G-MC3]